MENHLRAEQTEFAKTLLSGDIDPKLYYKYITNQMYIYSALESALPLETLDITDIARTDKISEDLYELETKYGFEFSTDLITDTTNHYLMYVSLLAAKCPKKLIPHMYVRHFGDMFGGAIVSKKIPGLGRMYEFDDKKMLISKVREILTLDMADEANVCFEYAIQLFEDLGLDYE